MAALIASLSSPLDDENRFTEKHEYDETNLTNLALIPTQSLTNIKNPKVQGEIMALVTELITLKKHGT